MLPTVPQREAGPLSNRSSSLSHASRHSSTNALLEHTKQKLSTKVELRSASDTDLRRPLQELPLSSSPSSPKLIGAHAVEQLRLRNPNVSGPYDGWIPSPRSARSRAKNMLSFPSQGSDMDDVGSTCSGKSGVSGSFSPPQATTMLLKAMQRQCRNEDSPGEDDTALLKRCSQPRSSAEETDPIARSLARPATQQQPRVLEVATQFQHSRSLENSRPPRPASPSASAAAELILKMPESRLSKNEESGLLARRRLKLPGLEAKTLQDLQAARHPSKAATQRIRRLKPKEKIYDLYYWSTGDVIQENGSGGKVVVCAPKVSGDLSPLLSPKTFGSPPGSPLSGLLSSKNHKVGGTHVMKMKSKEDLRKTDSEECFRKSHLKMLNLPPHLGILPLHEVLEDNVFYYVIMEKANGGSLLCNLVEEYPDGLMPEKAVKRLVKEILAGVEHLHMQGILHRDIKVDNLVVHVDDEIASPCGKIKRVKLIDFDIADPDWIPHSPAKKMRDWVGTMANSAPETFRGIFSQQSDLYSIGTVLYLLMAGRQCHDESVFEVDDDFYEMEIVIERLAKSKICWEQKCWRDNPLGRDFCQLLLNYDPLKRPATAEIALKHPWFSTNRPRHAVATAAASQS